MIDTRVKPEDLNSRNQDTMISTLGIEFTEVHQDRLVARMPVDRRTCQPLGLLHGGASAALAETVGSTAAYLSVDRNKYYTLGLEIKCNHVKSATPGYVYATAKAVHTGNKTHVWEVAIKDEQGNMVCFCTHTIIVMDLDEGMRERFKDLFFIS
jgi:1,4-dihydroxy-2-naphthoyl-CoA hydrolase